MTLDIDFVRSRFPAFTEPSLAGWGFFENAGGSYSCRHTIAALDRYYRENKVQPYGFYPASQKAGEAMDRSHERWAATLGVAVSEVHFGPSTSMNTYVLAKAISDSLGPGDEVVVTNQDHEANTGALRRATKAAGARLVEWAVDPESGRLDPEQLGGKLTARTKFVTFPHASNIIGDENDVQQLSAMAHEAGARVIVDGVSFAPHSIPNLAVLSADVYLFSLYKTYSVHQGLMVVRDDLADELPNQGHYFNAGLRNKRLTPAGPDHAQVAAAGAVIDYITELGEHHGFTGSLSDVAASVSALWRSHESALLEPLMAALRAMPSVRVLGSDRPASQGDMYRCPTVAVALRDRDPADVARALASRQLMVGAGHFYAKRLVEALGIDAARGVLRLSFVHYTSLAEVEQLISALQEELS